MVIGNFMLLSNINPTEGYKWFMEFSIDSYDWVMCQNVYEMVFFNTGGLTTRKPYFSSSNYLLRMSKGYSKTDDWVHEWNTMYNAFLKKHKEKLKKFKYYFRSIKA